MKKIVIALISIGALCFVYWCIFNNFDVKVKVINKSQVILDSINVGVFPDKKISFRNLKPGDTAQKTFDYRNFFYPRGEHGAAWALAYIDNYYFLCSTGLVDTPFVLLEDEYVFYIWDNGISTRPDIKPLGERTEKYPIK